MESGNHGDPRKLFLGGLPNNATKETVTDYLSQFGEVLGVDIPRHPNGGNSRGFCFVCFRDVESTQRALNHAEHIIHGKKVEVKQAIPKPSGCSASTSNKLSKRIFVGGLPQDCTNEELREHFESFGAVVAAFVVVNSNTSKNRGFGFVTFESYAAAENALISRSQMLKNKLIEVKPAERKITNTSPSNVPPCGSGSGSGNGNDGALRAVGLNQGNNVVHGQYNHNPYFDIGGVNTAYASNMVPYGYNLQNCDQCGASYLMYTAYLNPYNYQDYYQPFHYAHSGQGCLPLQNGQESPPAEEVPQTPSVDGQAQPPQKIGQDNPLKEESSQTPNGELSDVQLQTPQQNGQDGPPPPAEEIPQTPSGSSPERAIYSDDPPDIVRTQSAASIQ